jgi:hypothetical protein
VAEELQHRQRADQVEEPIGEPDVQELRAPGEEAHDGDEQDGERADGVAGEDAVEDGRPPDGAGDGEGERDDQRDGGDGNT